MLHRYIMALKGSIYYDLFMLYKNLDTEATRYLYFLYTYLETKYINK